MTRFAADLKWYASLAELAAFHAEHGRWPRAGGVNVPATEKRLGTWLTRQRRASRGLGTNAAAFTSERRDALDTQAPGWGETYDAGSTWQSRLGQLVAFHTEHGRLPRMNGENLTEAERMLGRWLQDQRQSAKGQGRSAVTFTPERRQALDANVPGWNAGHDAVWNERLDAVVTFRAEHGRLPRTAGTRMHATERKLGLWLAVQRQAVHGRGGGAASFTPERRRALDTRLPGWDASSQDAWEENLTAVVTFHAEHGRLPRKSGGNLPAEEKKLGDWLNRQRHASRGKTTCAPAFTPERRQALDSRLPGWDGRTANS